MHRTNLKGVNFGSSVSKTRKPCITGNPESMLFLLDTKEEYKEKNAAKQDRTKETKMGRLKGNKRKTCIIHTDRVQTHPVLGVCCSVLFSCF